jgi:methionyl-tRNA synthetase
MATVEDFAKLDIRIGRVVNVEDHPTARKPMYKLTVEFGPELGTRTIIAGIKGRYAVDELLNRKFAFIVNLDPKNVAGIESQGMLLAAGDLENVSILVPDREIEEGSKVH